MNVVAQGKNGLEAINLIREHNPDLVFLDVQMPGLDGFGVIKKLLDRKVPLPKIVFATAFDQYAVKAFEVNAVDYILKPFDKKRVAQSIEKARTKIDAGAGPEEKFETLVRMLESQKPQDGQDSDQGRGQVIPDRCQGYLLRHHRGWRDHGHHQRPRGHGRPLELPHPGRAFRESRPKLFWRAHRSFLVNINHIREVVPWFKSSYQLRMDDKKQTEIPVSRAQTRRLRELFNL